jgi:DNA-binding transcriptional LysR family regulator
MDRLDRLRTFLEVADRASFAEAARARRISAAAASRAVASLEQELGVALLRRTTRHVALTPEGVEYLEHGRRALAELEDAARSLRGEDAEPRGLLVVTAPVVFGRMHILPVVTELLRRYPALKVRLSLTDRIVRMAEEGIDVAVRIADLSDSSLHAVRLTETKPVLVASPEYLGTRGVPGHVAALHDHHLLAFDNLTQAGEWRFGPARGGAVRFEPRLSTDNVEAAIEAAVAGAGIARALCYQVRDHVAAGRLAYVLLEQDQAPLPVTLLFQANRRRSPNVRALIAAAQQRFKSADSE